MKKDQKRTLYKLIGFAVPILTIISPSWLFLLGVGPRWAELWLLPWALEEGPLSGLFAGFCLGVILDSINLGSTTYIPSLMFLGYCWGRLGRKIDFSDQFFTLGVLAWLGSLASGLVIWGQETFLVKSSELLFFNSWAFQTVLAGSIMTGLIAPLFCSWSLKYFFKGKG